MDAGGAVRRSRHKGRCPIPLRHGRRRGLRAAVLLLGLLPLSGLAACGGSPEAPVPPGLAYQEPAVEPSHYVFSDTSVFTLDAPGYGPVEVVTTREGAAELSFDRREDGYRVMVRFHRFMARFQGGDGAMVVADEDDIGGPVGVALGFRGAVAVVDSPAVSPALRQTSGLDGLVRAFFAHLPARPVVPGDGWVDTVTIRDDAGGMMAVTTATLVSTLTGDTLVDGRRLLRIATVAEVDRRVSGLSGGVEVEQRLEGTVRGVTLWDDVAHMLVARTEWGELRGTLGMPAAGVVGLPVTVVLNRRTSLRP